MGFLKRFEGPLYALLRIVVGFLFCLHGVQKILGFFRVGFPPDFQVPVGSEVWFAGMIELIAGFGIMIGWQTRLFAFLSSGEMAVAYYQGHWHGQMGAAFLPVVNGGELAALYSFILLFVAAYGPGSWAVDKKG